QAVRLDTVETICREVAHGSLAALAGIPQARDTASRLVLWNPAARPRSGIVTAELSWFRKDVVVGMPAGRKPRLGAGYSPFVLEALGAAPLPVQLLARRVSQE